MVVYCSKCRRYFEIVRLTRSTLVLFIFHCVVVGFEGCNWYFSDHYSKQIIRFLYGKRLD
jgi:hypothetical protein